MPEKHIRKTLEELRDELGNIDEVDPSLRDLLAQVDTDIHQLLDADEREQSQTDALMERIEALGADFAARHPQTERFFQELVATLGRLGI